MSTASEGTTSDRRRRRRGIDLLFGWLRFGRPVEEPAAEPVPPTEAVVPAAPKVRFEGHPF